jgi:outer membrane protein OmpA-like peptidoglycan-associated protein
MEIHMLVRTIAMGLAVMATAVSVDAQERGTVEFGVFGSGGSYDDGIGLDNGWGAGGRVGAFLFPRLSVEFEAGGSSAPPTIGAGENVNVGVLSGRLTGVPIKAGPLSILAGLGVNHTDASFLESYGVHGLLGAKLAISEHVALRLDGIRTRMSNGGGWNNALHLGVSLYRHPANTTTVVTRTVETAAPPRADSVSAAETRRLRAIEASHQALRDSIARAGTGTGPSAGERATMVETIHFQNERAVLSEEAKRVLRSKIAVFRANPTMRIMIVGHASRPGTAAYNMELGLERAEAARAFLVSEGIAASRIEIATEGAGRLLMEGTGEAADAANRRGEFRLLVADMS